MSRSWICAIASLSCSLSSYAQEKPYPTDKLKLALTFGNEVVMAYDELPRDGQLGDNSKQASGMMPAEISLYNGDQFYYQGKSVKAVGQYHEALARLVAAPTNPSASKGVDIFAISAMKDKRFTAAERLLKRVDRSQLDKGGWLTLATALNTTGIYYHQVGQLNVAEQLYLKALEIQGTQAGKSSEYYVSTLHNIAVLRRDQGRYDAAEDILKYVIRYYEKLKSRSSYQYMVALNNQAMLYANLGRTSEATQMLTDLSAGFDATSPSLDQARLLVNRGLLESESGHDANALALMTSAQKIFERHEAQKHPDYLQIRLYIARLQLQQGNTTNIKPLIDQVIEDFPKDQGTDNLLYARTLELKGDYLLAIRDYPNAQITFQRVADIRAAKLGTLHKNYISALNNVAYCQWQRKDLAAALGNFKMVATSNLEVVAKYFYNMSEKEKTQFWNELRPQLDAFYAFALATHKTNSEVLSFAYDLRLRTKGLLLNNSSRIRQAINNLTDGKVREQYAEWVSLKEALAAYYSMEKEAIAGLELDIAALEMEANDLEKEINRAIYGTEIFKGNEQVTSKQLASALKPDEGAMEVIRLNALPGSSQPATYIGLLLKADQSVQLITIGDARELESKYLALYKNAIRTRTKESATHEKLWVPIQSQLGGLKKIYISLDGVYNLINLNSLQSDAGQYVIDNYVIEVVPNTGVVAKVPSDQHNQKFVLVGNPVFTGRDIVPLPGTQKEIESIQVLTDAGATVILTGSAATESAIKDIAMPKVLHVATHGFFMNDAPPTTNALSNGLTRSTPSLSRSGLLLTRNETMTKPGQDASYSDGVLTAYEAMNMNLQHTDLVVLSACETGKGEIMNGEGVFGLQRALTIAGARHLIMSLWKVDDAVTEELMTTFYKQWTKSGDLEGSFVEAQRTIKASHPDPYYWSAFVLMVNR